MFVRNSRSFYESVFLFSLHLLVAILISPCCCLKSTSRRILTTNPYIYSLSRQCSLIVVLSLFCSPFSTFCGVFLFLFFSCINHNDALFNQKSISCKLFECSIKTYYLWMYAIQDQSKTKKKTKYKRKKTCSRYLGIFMNYNLMQFYCGRSLLLLIFCVVEICFI